jgi:ABC-2 type transport system ATP-binding protein
MTTKSLIDSNDFVTFQGVTKNYNSFKALNNVSFSIKEGEIFGYIGPNGAGKTTSMKILVGLITNFKGEVAINGYRLPEKKAEIYKLLGYLPQSVAFQDWRTVNHALVTFGKLSGLEKDKIEQKIPEILELIGLSDVRHKKVSQLSGGMIQKVGLAQALLHEPKLLVLDEPLGGLDPLSRHKFKEIVLKLASNGATVLFSSHILSDVQDVADRVGIINHGEIKQVGTINDLKAALSSKKTLQILMTYASNKWQKLNEVKNVTDIQQPSPGKVLLDLKADANEDQVVNDVVQKIVELGIRIRGVTLLEPSLDEIYLNYVSETEN